MSTLASLPGFPMAPPFHFSGDSSKLHRFNRPMHPLIGSAMTDPHPLGVFTSIDAGFGVPLEFARELSIPSVHVHAPHADTRTDELADRFLANCEAAGITITVVFMGFDSESYASIAETARTIGLVPREHRAARAAEAREMAAFGRRVGCPVMGMHIGFVPEDRDGDANRDSKRCG